MRLRPKVISAALVLGVALSTLAVAPAAARPAPTIQQILKGEKEMQTCFAAIKSKKVVTKAAHAACVAGDIASSVGCPKKSGVELFAYGVNHNLNSYYLMTVGHRPEKATLPQGAQVAYVCKHGTLAGAPAPFSTG